MPRETLPNRRRSETIKFQAGVPGYPLSNFIATVGFYPDGRVGEIFLHSSKSGSDRCIAMQEAAVTASQALQWGCPLESLRSAMPRAADGTPEGPLGTLFDLIAEQQKADAA
jgi:hypothetical protein